MGSKPVRVVYRHVTVWCKPHQQVESTRIFHIIPDKNYASGSMLYSYIAKFSSLEVYSDEYFFEFLYFLFATPNA